MIQAGVQNRQAFICLVEDINLFEFEDRKRLQAIVLELIGQERGNNELAMILRQSGQKIIDSLLD